MIKLNRIGNKLGLAGLAGILLAAGMLVNQMTSETEVLAFGERATRQQKVAELSLEGNIGLRRMQVDLKDIRLAREAETVRKKIVSLGEAKVYMDKKLDEAITVAVRQERKEQIGKIKSIADSFHTGAMDLAGAQLKSFEVSGKRSEAVAQWSKAADGLKAAAADAGNRLEIERALFELDSHFNAIRAAVWRYAGTGDESQRDVVVKRNAMVADALQRMRAMSADKSFAAGIEVMAAAVKKFNANNDESLQIEAAKTELINVKTVPVADAAIKLMREAVDGAVANAASSKAEADAVLERAHRNSMILGIAIVVMIAGSIVFTFLGVARPLTRLNGALGRIANGELGIEIPGASRGDEVGDIAKTVVVIASKAVVKGRQ